LINNNGDDSFVVRPLNMENTYKLEAYKEEIISFNVDFNFISVIENYIIICLENSEQVDINNKNMKFIMPQIWRKLKSWHLIKKVNMS